MSEKEELEIESPMTGTVTMLYVEEGGEVEYNENIIGIECMKMLYDVRAPFAGTVRYRVQLGEVVNQDDVVAILEID